MSVDPREIAKLITENPDVPAERIVSKDVSSEPGPTLDERRAYFGITGPSRGPTDTDVLYNDLVVDNDGSSYGELIVWFDDSNDLHDYIVNYESDIVNGYGDIGSGDEAAPWGWKVDMNYDIVLSADPTKEYKGDRNKRGWPSDLPAEHGSGIATLTVLSVEPREYEGPDYDDPGWLDFRGYSPQ